MVKNPLNWVKESIALFENVGKYSFPESSTNSSWVKNHFKALLETAFNLQQGEQFPFDDFFTSIGFEQDKEIKYAELISSSYFMYMYSPNGVLKMKLVDKDKNLVQVKVTSIQEAFKFYCNDVEIDESEIFIDFTRK